MARVLGNYDVRRRLAVGGSTEILLASGPAGPVAVRRLLPLLAADAELSSRVAAAALRAKPLAHPNVVRVLDVDTDAGGLAIVTELVDGLPLRELLDRTCGRGEALDVKVAAFIAAQVAEGLAAVHALDGQPHAGVSAEHVLLARGGAVKLVDCSISRAMLGRTVGPDGSTRSPSRYAAPELLRLEKVDGAADLWSLGIVLFELLTGSVPFDAATDAAALDAMLHAPVPPLRELRGDCPQALDLLVRRCLERSPVKRPAGARALRDELLALAGPLPQAVAQLAALVERVSAAARPTAQDTSAPFLSDRSLGADGALVQSRPAAPQPAGPAAPERLELSRAAVPRSSRLQSHDTGRPTLSAAPKPARVELPPEGPPPLKLPALDGAGSNRRGGGGGLSAGAVAGLVVAVLGAVLAVVWSQRKPEALPVAPPAPPRVTVADQPDADLDLDPQTGTGRTLQPVAVAPTPNAEELSPPRYFVDSEPGGAQVRVNGQAVGSTPWGSDGEVGKEAVIEVRKQGFQPWSTKVDAGHDLTVTVKLKRK